MKMLIACDVGNTAATFGLFEGDRLVHFASEPARDCRFGELWKREFSSHDPSDVTGAIICSVNPPADRKLRKCISDTFKQKPLVVGENVNVLGGKNLPFENKV